MRHGSANVWTAMPRAFISEPLLTHKPCSLTAEAIVDSYRRCLSRHQVRLSVHTTGAWATAERTPAQVEALRAFLRSVRSERRQGGMVSTSRGRVNRFFGEFSAMHLGRPGLGDKIFDKWEQSMPLLAISASPPEGLSNESIMKRASFDSILDNDRRSSMDDSIFDKTGNRSSMSSEFVFGGDEPTICLRSVTC